MHQKRLPGERAHTPDAQVFVDDDMYEGGTHSALSSIFRTLQQYRTLTHEETLALARQARRGNRRAAERLLLHNLRLVVKIAKRYQGRGLPLEDLIQEGTIGMQWAVKKFDPRRGLHISTYATYWIRQAVGRALSDRGHLIRIPVGRRNQLYTLRRIKRTVQVQEQELSWEEAAHAVVSRKHRGRRSAREEKAVRRLLHAQSMAQDTISLDYPMRGDEDGRLLQETLKAPAPDQDSERTDPWLWFRIAQAIEALEARSRFVVIARYVQGLTLDQTALQLNLVRERVRQIEVRALCAIKRECQATSRSPTRLTTRLTRSEFVERFSSTPLDRIKVLQESPRAWAWLALWRTTGITVHWRGRKAVQVLMEHCPGLPEVRKSRIRAMCAKGWVVRARDPEVWYIIASNRQAGVPPELDLSRPRC